MLGIAGAMSRITKFAMKASYRSTGSGLHYRNGHKVVKHPGRCDPELMAKAPKPHRKDHRRVPIGTRRVPYRYR
jgi:hypothetical protein